MPLATRSGWHSSVRLGVCPGQAVIQTQ
jgi:hypothetical protein